METLANIVLLLNISIFFFGQLLRIQVFNLSVPLIDISLLLLAFTNLVLFVKKPAKINRYGLFFIILNIFLLLINSTSTNLQSLLYFARLSSLLSLLIFPTKIFSSKRSKKAFNLILISNIVFSLLQYLIWPDFTYFSSQNWDPHLHRLVGTFFDPTFTALIFLFFIIDIYFNLRKNPFQKFLLALSYLALSFTYSRSSLLAFTITFIYIFLSQKEYRKIIFLIALVTSTIFLLPRKAGEGTKLERSSSILAKIENYKNAFSLYQKSPLLGIGYNNISTQRLDKNPTSHANSAFDSSLLNILICTGPLGLFLFLKTFKKQSTRPEILKNSLYIAIFTHSLFANSLLYPWILFYLIYLLKSRK